MSKRQHEHETDDEGDRSDTPKSKAKKKKWLTKFKLSYVSEFPCLEKSPKGPYFAHCKVCVSDFNISHGGRDDCKKHVETKKHADMGKLKTNTQFSMEKFISTDSSLSVVNAEALFTCFLLEHNLPIAAADHAGQLFRKMFPDSNIAKNYSSARTKTGAIINEMSTIVQSEISSSLSSLPFSISTDGSNDLTKIYPVVIRYYDSSRELILPKVLAIPNCSGDCTGKNIFETLDDTLKSNHISWTNCISLGSDSAAVMTGVHIGVISFIREKQPEVFLLRCPCHLIHLAAQKAYNELHFKTKADEVLVDIYYYLDKSAKRLQKLKEFQTLSGVNQKKILKHVSTRWLSLGTCINRLLEQWHPLSKFFDQEVQAFDKKTKSPKDDTKTKESKTQSAAKSTNSDTSNQSQKSNAKPSTTTSETKQKSSSSATTSKSQSKTKTVSQSKTKTVTVVKTSDAKSISSSSGACNTTGKSTSSSTGSTGSSRSSKGYAERKSRAVQEALHSQSFRLYCEFLDYIIPVFNGFNMSLQREQPYIHKLRLTLLDLIKEIMLRFVDCKVLSDHEGDTFLEIEYWRSKNQKDDDSIMIGINCREILDKVSHDTKKYFLEDVRRYYRKAADYMISVFLLKDEVLVNSVVLDVTVKKSVKFSQLKYFCKKFPCLLPGNNASDEMNQLEREFCLYQCENLSESILSEERLDTQWNMIGKIKDINTNLKFSLLSSVMLGIAVLPHNNVDCERMFSQVRKNRTDFRPSLSDSTLESLIVKKLHMGSSSCYEQKFNNADLKRFKSATYASLQ